MLTFLFLSIFPATLMVAAATDIHDFKIPNWISGALLIGFFSAGISLGTPIELLAEGLLLGCAVLVVGFFLFAVRFFGGGDAKLFAATAPWIGLAAFPEFLMATAIAGGFLAIFLLVFRKTPPLPVYAHAQWLLRMHQNQHELPYGVAIAAGGIFLFPETPLFKFAFGG